MYAVQTYGGIQKGNNSDHWPYENEGEGAQSWEPGAIILSDQILDLVITDMDAGGRLNDGKVGQIGYAIIRSGTDWFSE